MQPAKHAYTQIPGHGLLGEGAAFDDNGQRLHAHTGNRGRAKCSCGALSEPLPSGYARRIWHRDVHKPSVIEAQSEANLATPSDDLRQHSTDLKVRR